jgi:hypothetical protein
MKKLFCSSLFLLAFLFCANQGFAQTSIYKWASYGASFAIPNTHKVKVNTAEAFESGDKNTWLELYPYKDETESAEGMIDKLLLIDGVKVSGRGEYTTGGYEGHWARCERESHPDWYFWYIGIVDPKTAVNFYAVVWYKKGDDAAYETASKMVYSFQKM